MSASFEKIFGITVSKNYSDFLDILIDKNSHLFDVWFIATQEDDTQTRELIKKKSKDNIVVVYYPLEPSKHTSKFTSSLLVNSEDLEISIDPRSSSTKSEIIFDKGGALRTIQKFYLPDYNVSDKDLVLVIDSDVILPSDLRTKLKRQTIKYDYLYGSARCDYLKFSDFKQQINKKKYSREREVDGYFHLYRYSPTKLYKRTIDCGWVDLEFTYQFDHKQCISEIEISHLGRPGVNWQGRTQECFLFDNNFEFLKNEAEKFNIDLNNGKDFIVSELEKKYNVFAINKLIDSPKLPEFVVPGFPSCGTTFLKNHLIQHPSIEFGYRETGDINYCLHKQSTSNKNLGHAKFGHEWYMSHFFRDSNVWGDASSGYFSRGWRRAIDCMKIMYVDKKWDWMPDIKFIVVLRNPIDRAIQQYEKYIKNFPSSASWNWLLPGQSFSENIDAEFKQIGKILPNWNVVDEDYCGRFLLDGYYAGVLKYFTDTLKLTEDTFLVVNYEKITKFDRSEWSRIFDFLGVESFDMKMANECDDVIETNLDDKTKDTFRSFYKELNDELFDLIGYEIKEWVV